ncbi:MAG: hypothetical protein JRE81_10790 [Deltaproteobacteria bacterium]|nr:hypothetical protein [Deltaproteobacteria bacterium]
MPADVAPVGASFTALSCGDEGGVHCCAYESRHSACGGGDYTPWETNYYEFNTDDYVEGWSTSEERNNVLSTRECPGESI